MEHGKTTGKLTTKEITDALEKLDYDVEQMDSFYDSCAANNIEIIDDIITDDSLDMVNPEDDLDQDGVDISLSTDGIAIDDPVKIYRFLPPRRRYSLQKRCLAAMKRTLKKQEKDWQKQTSDLLFLSQRNMWAEE